MTLQFLQRSVTAAACGAALLLASASPAWADDSEAFKVAVTISETLTPGNSNCAAVGVVTGSGLATEMGPVSVSAFDCINFSSPTSFNFQTLKDTRVVLTAATGEQLFAFYKGTSTPKPFPIMAITGSITFQGGTGRFARASGNGSLQGVENIGTVPATGVILMSGKLSLD
jgi:hypothetical protein